MENEGAESREVAKTATHFDVVHVARAGGSHVACLTYPVVVIMPIPGSSGMYQWFLAQDWRKVAVPTSRERVFPSKRACRRAAGDYMNSIDVKAETYLILGDGEFFGMETGG